MADIRHTIVVDKPQLGERFIICSCGNTAQGGAHDDIAQRNHEYHVEQASKVRAEEMLKAAREAFYAASGQVEFDLYEYDGETTDDPEETQEGKRQALVESLRGLATAAQLYAAELASEA